MSGIKQVNDDIKKIAHEKTAQIKVYNLYLIALIIDQATRRGAFTAAESSHVGSVYDIIIGGLNKAYEISEKDNVDKEIQKQENQQ